MNPLAVEIAAREGARTVWMPTVDSANETPGARRAEPRRQAAGLGEAAARAARARASRVEPVPVRRRRRRACCPRRARVLADDRAPRHGARHRAPRPRRDLRASSTRRSRRACATSSSRTPTSPPRTSRIEDQVELAAPRRAARALLHDAPHGQVHVGALARGHAGGRPRAHGALDRPRPGRQPAGRGRPAADGRQLLEAGFAEEEVRTMAVDQHAAAGGAGAMSRQLLAIGAHAADFVWRAGGALARGGRGRRHARA